MRIIEKKTLDNTFISSKTWDINQTISMSEIESAVLSMKNKKAPGPDGILAEFFKASLDLDIFIFWNKVK